MTAPAGGLGAAVVGGVGISPTSGNWATPGLSISNAAGALTSGQMTMMRIDMGGVDVPIQSLGCNVTTVRFGGTALEQVAIYGDDGSRGNPVFSNMIASATLDLSVGLGKASAAATGTLRKNLSYWACMLYVETVAPGTLPQVSVSTNALSLWTSNGLFPTNVRALSVTGLTALPSGPKTIQGITTGGVIVGARAA